MSGELVFRPGIDQVRAGVAARRWDLILVEDSGRLFRHETACGELIETAVDNGIRVLAINDDVDTAEEDWEDPLHEAMRHHARSNRYTAKRIKRKLEGLWRRGRPSDCCGLATGADRPGPQPNISPRKGRSLTKSIRPGPRWCGGPTSASPAESLPGWWLRGSRAKGCPSAVIP